MQERQISANKLLEWLARQSVDYVGYGSDGTAAIRYIKWRIENSRDFDPDKEESQ